MISDLEMTVQSVIAEQAQMTTGDDKQLLNAQQLALQKLVSRLRQIKATGRMSITMAPLASLKNTALDFELHEGDHLHIPQRPNFISVVGSVYSQSSFMFDSTKKLKDYLNNAGGPKKTADRDAIYVMKANGEVVTAAKMSVSQLMPGDTIVVPEDLDRIPTWKVIKDVTDIVFKIATSAGIVFAILDD